MVDHDFDTGKMEDARKFVRTKKALVNHIRMTGDLEATYVADSLESMSIRGPPRPPRPTQIPDPNDASQQIDDDVEIMIWEGELKGYAKRWNNFVEGTKKAYATIWGICTPALKSKIEETPGYAQLNSDKDRVNLLEVIRNAVCGQEDHRQTVYSLV